MEWRTIHRSQGAGELIKPGTRNKERRNGKWEMTEMGNGGNSSKNSATELAVTMKSQAYRLAVVLQPSLLC